MLVGEITGDEPVVVVGGTRGLGVVVVGCLLLGREGQLWGLESLRGWL